MFAVWNVPMIPLYPAPFDLVKHSLQQLLTKLQWYIARALYCTQYCESVNSHSVKWTGVNDASETQPKKPHKDVRILTIAEEWADVKRKKKTKWRGHGEDTRGRETEETNKNKKTGERKSSCTNSLCVLGREPSVRFAAGCCFEAALRQREREGGTFWINCLICCLTLSKYLISRVRRAHSL